MDGRFLDPIKALAASLRKGPSRAPLLRLPGLWGGPGAGPCRLSVSPPEQRGGCIHLPVLDGWQPGIGPAAPGMVTGDDAPAPGIRRRIRDRTMQNGVLGRCGLVRLVARGQPQVGRHVEARRIGQSGPVLDPMQSQRSHGFAGTSFQRWLRARVFYLETYSEALGRSERPSSPVQPAGIRRVQ